MNRRLTALALVAVAAFGLTACTGSPAASPSGSASASAGSGSTDEGTGGSGSQTVAEACTVVQENLQEVMAEFEGTLSEFGELSAEDPAQAMEALGRAADAMSAAGTRLGELADQVSNTEVASALPHLEEAFAMAGEVFAAVGSGDITRLAELQTLPADLQESIATFQELCAA